MKPNVVILVAVSNNFIIGIDNDLPWKEVNLKTDKKHFKEKTEWGIVVMGHNTYDSLDEQYRPLPKRLNIVITSKTEEELQLPEEVIRYSSLDEALKELERQNGDIFIIGGSWLYNDALPIADKLYITRVAMDVPIQDGQKVVRFPEDFNAGGRFKLETKSETISERGCPSYVIEEWVRAF